MSRAGWHGTGPCPEWAAAILARDPDVLIDDKVVEVLHRPGETLREYAERVGGARPPLSDRQKETIRRVFGQYWARSVRRAG